MLASPYRCFTSALLALVASSCAGLPPYSAEIDGLIAHGNSASEAAQLARRGWTERERLLQLLPGAQTGQVVLLERPPEQMPGPFAHGYTETPGFGAWRTASADRVVLSTQADDAVLAHELVHALLGPDWSTLPPVLEEGLADSLAFELHPHSYLQVERWQAAVWREVDVQVEHVLALGGAREAGSFTLRLRPGPDAAPFGPGEALELSASIAFGAGDAARGNRFYGLGLAMIERLIERIGLDGLHALAISTRAEGEPLMSTTDIRKLLGEGSDLLPRAWLESRLADAFQRSLLDFPEIETLLRDRTRAAKALDPEIDSDGFAAALSLRMSIDGGFWISWRELQGYDEVIESLANEFALVRN